MFDIFPRSITPGLTARWCLAVVTALLAALPAGIVTGQETGSAAPPVAQAEGKFAPGPAIEQPQPQRRLPASQRPARIVLDPVEPELFAREIAAILSRPAPGVPMKIGFGREVEQLKSSSQTAGQLTWAAVNGGRIAAITLVSPAATGLRLGLLIDTVPAAALLRFYAPKEEGAKVVEVTGRTVMETVARNIEAGDHSEAGRTYWSPMLTGEELTVEIELPAGVAPDEMRFAIPQITHILLGSSAGK